MQNMDELRKRQMAITEDFKARAQKAEKLLVEIDACEKKLSELSEALSSVLYIDVMQATAAAKVSKAKPSKVKAVRTAKSKSVEKPSAGPSLKNIVRDFLAKAGKPMKIAEIVSAMQKAGHVLKASKPVVAMRFLIYNNKKMFKRVKRGTFVAVAADAQQAEVAEPAKVPQVKTAKVKVIKAAKTAKVKPAAVKPAAKKVEAPTLKDSVRDFMLKVGKPMKIAEIVQAMQKAGQAFQAKKPVKAMTKLMYNNAKVFKRVKPGTFKAV